MKHILLLILLSSIGFAKTVFEDDPFCAIGSKTLLTGIFLQLNQH